MFYHRSTSSYYVECPKNLGYVEVDYLLSNITIKNISGFIINKFAIKQKSSYPRAFSLYQNPISELDMGFCYAAINQYLSKKIYISV